MYGGEVTRSISFLKSIYFSRGGGGGRSGSRYLFISPPHIFDVKGGQLDMNKLMIRLFIPIISFLCRDSVGGSRNERVKVKLSERCNWRTWQLQPEILIPVILFCHHYKST